MVKLISVGCVRHSSQPTNQACLIVISGIAAAARLSVHLAFVAGALLTLFTNIRRHHSWTQCTSISAVESSTNSVSWTSLDPLDSRWPHPSITMAQGGNCLTTSEVIDLLDAQMDAEVMGVRMTMEWTLVVMRRGENATDSTIVPQQNDVLYLQRFHGNRSFHPCRPAGT